MVVRRRVVGVDNGRGAVQGHRRVSDRVAGRRERLPLAHTQRLSARHDHSHATLLADRTQATTHVQADPNHSRSNRCRWLVFAFFFFINIIRLLKMYVFVFVF